MGEGLTAHLEKTLATGAKAGESFFAIHRRKARTESEAKESKNDLEAIERRLITFIKNGIESINWYDREAIDKFCSSLDGELEKASKRFIKAHNRIEEGTGPEKWKALTDWLGDIRQKSKAEITAEIDMLEQATAPPPSVKPPSNRAPAKKPEPLTHEQQKDKKFAEPFIAYARERGVPEELVQTLTAYTLKLNQKFTPEEKNKGEENKALEETQSILNNIVN